MPTCPKCHRFLEEEEVCCAEVRHTWRCVRCFKLSTGSAVPYGKCFLCGGELELLAEHGTVDCINSHAVHDAMQFELDLVHFFELARERSTRPEQFVVLEHLCEAALDHLHELEDKYRAHLDRDMVDVASDEERLLVDWPVREIQFNEAAGVAALYRGALEMERRARDHFRDMADESPPGLENELCRELTAEEDEHIAMLETEIEQLV